jgi:hypothetical protein
MLGPSHCATYVTSSTLRPQPSHICRQYANGLRSQLGVLVLLRSRAVEWQPERPYIHIHTPYTMSNSPYDSCALAHNSNVHLTMQCVARWVESETTASAARMQAVAQDTKSWLLILSGALVFFMQVRIRERECACKMSSSVCV